MPKHGFSLISSLLYLMSWLQTYAPPLLEFISYSDYFVCCVSDESVISLLGKIQTLQLIILFLLYVFDYISKCYVFYCRFEKEYKYVRLAKLLFVSLSILFLVLIASVIYWWYDCCPQLALFASHCGACFFHAMAASYHTPQLTWIGQAKGDLLQQSIWSRYVLSLYWSVGTLTSVVYGDIHPVNEREMVFVIVYQLINLGLASYLVGNLTKLVVHDDSNRIENFVSISFFFLS